MTYDMSGYQYGLSSDMGERDSAWLTAAGNPWLVGFLGGVVASGAVAGGLRSGVWFQPTAIGMLWGATFLAGWMVAYAVRGSVPAVVAAVGLAGLGYWGNRLLSDLAGPDSLVCVAVLTAAGWATSRLDRGGRMADHGPQAGSTGHGVGRWSIGDLIFLTFLAACLCRGLPNLQGSQVLWVGVAPVLLGGVLTSWLACRWVWLDVWRLRQLIFPTLGLILVSGVVWLAAPPGTGPVELMTWIAAGPTNVVAAQGTTVMLLLACCRATSDHSAVSK